MYYTGLHWKKNLWKAFFYSVEDYTTIQRIDDSAIDKMAARFWHTDDSATFLFEKKRPKNVSYPSRVSLKDFSYPLRVPERTYTTPHGVFLPLAGADF